MRQYLTETNFIISTQDFKNVRTLYLPIIGPNAVSLYQALSDETQTNKYKVDYRTQRSLLTSLQFTEKDLIESRKTLEAVGLIKTFEKNDETIFLFSIQKPLTIEKFKNNSILWQKLIQVIGDVEVERLVFENKTETIDKSEFTDVSAKYQDIFEIQTDLITKTSEIVAPKFNNKNDAIKGASPAMFTRFISNVAPSPTLLKVFHDLKNMSFSNKTINLIQDYSFKLNNKIVAKHIETIAYDFAKKDITSANDIQKELEKALSSRSKQKTTPTPISLTNEGGELSLEDIFSDLFS